MTKATIIDNREALGADIVRRLREATDNLDGLGGALRIIHNATKANIDLWNQVRALDEIEGQVREAYLELERELGLIPDYPPEGTRAERLPDPETVDAERLAAIEAALKPTGWTESLLEGEAIAVQLPGGLVVTVERPDRAPEHEETVPSVEDRFGKALEGFEWFDLAGLGDKDGNDDPGLADCAVLVSLKVLEKWDETGPEANIPWSVSRPPDLAETGRGWDLVCTVCDILDAMGRPDRTQAAIIELVPGTEVVTARTIRHERPTS